jgi:hypothetical protein
MAVDRACSTADVVKTAALFTGLARISWIHGSLHGGYGQHLLARARSRAALSSNVR